VDESIDVLGPLRYAPQAPGFEKLLSSQDRGWAPDQAGQAWTEAHSLCNLPCLPSTAPPYSTHAELNSSLHDINASVATPDNRDFPGPAT
jgi:hypothetical protein